MKPLIHLVSHTHWDREWYEPIQVFRARLVILIDKLLDVLASDPQFKYFMLDGQTIVLDDYLEIRPERRVELARRIREGRILVGPWYILPDEFLVSGESLVRNLLWGGRKAKAFGQPMMVGYIPDPFGHIGQMPQILSGLGIDTVVLRRGLHDHPVELMWESPDKSRMLLIYLRDGYDNAARLPLDEGFGPAVRGLVASLAPYTKAGLYLLMNGTDHMEPQPEIPKLIAELNRRSREAKILHSKLPDYISAVKRTLGKQGIQHLPVIRGELRSSKRHHLLPGVLSARMYLKQASWECETFLEKWAEPFSIWAKVGTARNVGRHWPGLVKGAWRFLLQNQPHDSICGTSVDQVHREMMARYDQCRQLARTVLDEALRSIAEKVNTSAFAEMGQAIVVFNPLSQERSEPVLAEVETEGGDLVVRHAAGRELPTQVLGREMQELSSSRLDSEGIKFWLPVLSRGRVAGMAIRKAEVSWQGDTARAEITLYRYAEPDPQVLGSLRQKIEEAVGRGVRHFWIRAYQAAVTRILFLAEDIPGHGYKTFFLGRGGQKTSVFGESTPILENEFLRVEVDPRNGTLRVTDKATGATFAGLHQFLDEGDCGDEYNFCPVEQDQVVNKPKAPPRISWVENGPARQTIEIRATYLLPKELTPDRHSRSKESVEVPIISRVSLSPGMRRVEIEAQVVNLVRDHSLRVYFPTSIATSRSFAEGSFEVVERTLALPQDTAEWIEQPVPTQPQKSFVDVSDGQIGLMVASRGLPEYEVLPTPQGSTMALTLLRCVGWLSRGDLTTRVGHAGPPVETPEAQCPGEHTFHYAIIPHREDWREAYQEAHAFNAPLRSATTDHHPGSLLLEQSFLEIGPDSLVVSTVKRAEEGDAIIVRFYNITGEQVRGKVRPSIPYKEAWRVNLDEEKIKKLAPDRKGWISLPVLGHEIVTLRFLLDRKPGSQRKPES